MAIHFLDTFTRPDGTPDNGWTDITSGTTLDLVIQNNALTLASDGTTPAGIFRPINTALPLAAAAVITPETDSGGIQGHYDTTFLFGNDGTLTGGWGVEFLRSNEATNDSRVVLLHDGAAVATALSNFQFTTFDTFTHQGDIAVTVNIGPDGTVSGTVHGFVLGLFNFDFGPQSPTFTGSNFALIQAPPNGSVSGTNATIDNVEVAQGSGLVPTLIVKPSATFTEGAPVVLSPVAGTDTQIFDYNTPLLSHVSVHIVDAEPGDVLDASSLGGIPAANGFSYDAVTHTLNFYARDTLADYLNELSTVTFENTSDNPDAFGTHNTRTLQWQVTDSLVPSGPLFAPAQTYHVGTGPTSLIAPDFEGNPFFPMDVNGDGISDLVMATPGSGEISILRGNGDGTFVLASSLDVGGAPSSVDAGDYNADGLIDLAYVDQSTGTVSILLASLLGGSGPPTFSSPPVPVATVPGATSVRDALIKFSGPDDQETLMVAAPGGVHLFHSDLAAHFTVGPVLPAVNPSFVVTGSFGGSGGDVAIADQGTDSILIYQNDGNGNFILHTTIAEPLGSSPQSIAVTGVGDLNHDSFGDIVVANAGTDDVTVYFGASGGTFGSPEVLHLKAGAHPVSVTLVDVNGDGNSDIVAADQGTNDVAILLANVDNGIRDGTFQTPFYLDAGTGPSSLVSGDLDLDGNPDLVVANAGSNNVSVFLHSATTASDIVTTTVNVAAVNDPPVNTHPASITVHQGLPKTIAPLSVTDPDAQTMTLTLSVGHGTIHVRDDLGTGFLLNTDITGNDSNSVTVHAGLTAVNATLAALNGVAYTSGFLGGDLLTMVSNDGGGTGSGGPQSDTDTVTINVAAALQFNGLDNAPTFVENGAFVTLDNNAIIQNAVTLDGAVLTLQRDGGANPDDFFSSTFLTPDGEVDMGGGNIVGTYFLSQGLLNITFNSAANETAVNQLLQSLQYADFSDNPPSSAQIDYSFNDGIGTANGQILVNIIAVNDPPTLDGVSVAGIYAAGSPPIILSPGVLLSDPDSPNLTVATIRITNGFGGDTLTADPGATGITVTPGAFTLTLSGAHTLAQYQQVLDTVAYSSTDTDPTGGGVHPTRNIVWQVGDTGSEANSNTQTTLLQYAPLLDLDQSGAGTGFTGHFTENGASVAVADTDDFIFTSNTEIVGATITLTDAHPGDSLSYDNSVGGISASTTSSAGTITLTLSGERPAASYQTALQHVFFSNSSDNPDPSDRHISVLVTDEVTTSNTAVDVISVTPVNDPPQAQNGTLNAHVNHAASGTAVATDPDNTPDQLSYALVGANGGALHGTVSMDGHGNFTYTPAAGYTGPDSFNFNATDPGPATSNTGSISVTVAPNNAPVAQNGSASGNEDNPISGSAAASDPDGDSLTYALSGANGGAAHGTVSMDAAGHFTYTPAANFNGGDSFSFKANDGSVDSNTATESITVNPINDPPVAQNSSASGNEDTAINGTAVATDIDSASLTYSRVSNAAHGNVTVNANGTFSYTPNANFNGTDSFTFKANDGSADSNTATINLTVNPVNDAPVAQNGSASGNEDNTINGTLVATDIDSASLTFSRVTQAAHGTVTVNANGTFSYTPNADFNGSDSFTFKANDGSADSNAATVNLTVNPVNDPPVFAHFGTAHSTGTEQTFGLINGAATVSDVELDARNGGAGNYAGASLIIGRAGSGVPNPEDTFGFSSNGATFTVDTVNHVLLSGGQQFATYSIPQSGSLAGTISVNFNSLNTPATTALVDNVLQHILYKNLSDNPPASVTMHYTFNDGNTGAQGSGGALTDTANRTIDMTPVNDAPVAQDGSGSGNEDNVINGTLIAADVDSASLAFSRVVNAAHGTVTVNASGTYSYTPNSNFNGTDSFTFKANDGSLDSNVATVSLTVNPVNDPPVIVSDGGGDTATVSVPENTTPVTTVQATDIDSPSLTYLIVGGSDAGQFQINASSGALSFITAPDFEAPGDSDHNNTYVVQVQASDGSLTDTQTITVSVGNVDDVVRTVHWAASIDVGSHPGASMLTEAPIDHWFPAGIGDFNGDATSDLAWYNPTTRGVDIWKLSNGQWAGSSDLGTHAAGYQPVGFADFNHDSNADILWFNPTTRDVDLWKISNAQLAGSVDIGTHPAGYTPSGFGDYNGDGTADVLWYNATTRDVDIWKISNGQWAGSVAVGTHPAGYQPALSGDFNGDGTSDVAWFNSSTGDVDIWKMSNGQWAGSVDVGSHPAGWAPLGTADFNLDGTSDIVWYNPTNNDIDIWLMKNGQWAGSVDVGTHPAGWTAVGVGDFDHSGVPDIMWFNPSTGHVENWMLAFT
jgi:VCBS repeat-containing protein